MNARSKSAALVAAALAAILLPAAGCHKKVAPPPPPPPPAPAPVAPTATLTASPDTITAGQSSTLTWSSTDATSVTIDNGVGTVSAASGSQSVTPSTTTTYHLVARGDGGSTGATATVTVNQPPPPPPPPPAPALTESMFEQSVKPVFYGFDSYKLSSDAQQILTDSAAFLQAHPDVKVLVAGYCDERGSAEYNLALGQNRANAAKDALVKAGIDPSRLRTISYGKEKPFCTDHNEACWQQNRRAQFSIDQ
ncbi:MAG TPA: peptidoglycan-associated lipoprotein Pal [Acidobacteriaceae bacterium]|nr:peptidoglycan-associated lipoprotein Pal [Acidobacteriaceae bacterium]